MASSSTAKAARQSSPLTFIATSALKVQNEANCWAIGSEIDTSFSQVIKCDAGNPWNEPEQYNNPVKIFVLKKENETHCSSENYAKEFVSYN